MTDFVIVVAAIASIASAAPAGTGSVAVPDRAPTIGFKTYPSADACSEAAARLAARPGTRLVCLPVETPEGELQSAW